MQFGPHHGKISGIVSQSTILLVRRIVFLIDDDHTDVGKGCKDGRPGSNGNIHLATNNSHPLIVPLSVRKPAVQDRNTFTEPGAEAALHLGYKRDFRNQNQHTQTAAYSLGGKLQVNLGFPAAGNSCQKASGKAATQQSFYL